MRDGRTGAGAGHPLTGFDPWPESDVHVEWGSAAARLGAARGDDIVIVDVLSFSTTLTLAAEHGIDSYVYSLTELDSMGGRDAVARSVGARPAAAERAAGPGEVSLSPASIKGATGFDAVLFTSLNGAAAGFAEDVRLAAQLDVTDLVPMRDEADPTGRRFRAIRVAA